MDTVIYWIRRDLRVHDNPALAHAARDGRQVVPVYVHAPPEDGDWAPGAASNWWLDRSLRDLQARFERLGAPLIIRSGDSAAELASLAAECGATEVVCNRLFEPAAIERDRGVTEHLGRRGIRVRSFNAGLLFEPSAITTSTGTPYRVFTAFWRACRNEPHPPSPLPPPGRLGYARQISSLSIDTLELLPRVRWWDRLADHWAPGEDAGLDALEAFVDEGLGGYADDRDRPDRAGTSRLSPHLHFGELSPRQVWSALMTRPEDADRERFGAELGWREFSHHLLLHHPHSAEQDFSNALDGYPWRNDAEAGADFAAWTEGRTGVALVDAGMRELWRSGWMHNRVRMVVASYLTKNLRIHWRAGARWFWDTLVDADLASNTLGWQWVAGCGVDAAPYFRIFNPDTQAQRFDPDGRYRERWLKDHTRPQAPPVPLKASRAAALDAFKNRRGSRAA